VARPPPPPARPQKAKRKPNPAAVFANANTLAARLDFPVNEAGCGELLLKLQVLDPVSACDRSSFASVSRAPAEDCFVFLAIAAR
jgi:hypothetical protein